MTELPGPSRLRSITLAVVATLALLAGGFTFGAGTASAATSGYAMCANQANVVGVWVNVSGGVSGWATRTGSGYSQRWAYNTQGRSYSLTVGCGGTPQSWAASTSTPYYSTSWSNVTCFPGWSYGFGSVYAANRCYAG
ncbi:MAG TPA: hypothetical protein VJ872_17280 [Nocardioides sp.]|nr:hypothetical protein [Nocardioides sp.]